MNYLQKTTSKYNFLPPLSSTTTKFGMGLFWYVYVCILLLVALFLEKRVLVKGILPVLENISLPISFELVLDDIIFIFCLVLVLQVELLFFLPLTSFLLSHIVFVLNVRTSDFLLSMNTLLLLSWRSCLLCL